MPSRSGLPAKCRVSSRAVVSVAWSSQYASRLISPAQAVSSHAATPTGRSGSATRGIEQDRVGVSHEGTSVSPKPAQLAVPWARV